MSFVRPLVVLGLASVALFVSACGGSQTGDPRESMHSAGGLNESRMPNGIQGVTPAPTGALPKDKALEAGWYKHAKLGEKAPTYNDRGSI